MSAKKLSEYRQEAMALVDEQVNPAGSVKFSTAWWLNRINKAKNVVAQNSGFHIVRHLVPIKQYTEWSALPTALCWGILGVRFGRNPLDGIDDPFDFAMWNAEFPNQPTADGIEVVSASAADTTQTLTIYGTADVSDIVQREDISLTGTTQAVSAETKWDELLYAELDAVCDGDITIREASANATIAEIAAGDLTVGYLPDMGSPSDYRIQGQRVYWTPVPDAAYVVQMIGGGIPADLSGENDTIASLPAHFDSIIALGAAIEAEGIDLYDDSQRVRLNPYYQQFMAQQTELNRYLGTIDRSRTTAMRLGA